MTYPTINDALLLIYKGPALAARRRCNAALSATIRDPSDKAALIRYVVAAAALETAEIRMSAAYRALAKRDTLCEG